jgi:hypothetical protein
MWVTDGLEPVFEDDDQQTKDGSESDIENGIRPQRLELMRRIADRCRTERASANHAIADSRQLMTDVYEW